MGDYNDNGLPKVDERLRAGVAGLTGVDVNDLVLPEIGGGSQEERRIERLAQKKCQKAVTHIARWVAGLTVLGFVAVAVGENRGGGIGWHEAWHRVSEGIGDIFLFASFAVLGFAGWKVLKNKLKKNTNFNGEK